MYGIPLCKPLLRLQKGSQLCTIIFDTALSGHSKFFYNEIAFLLSLAVADKALYGLNSLQELDDIQIPEGDDKVQLLWAEEVKSRPILKTVTQNAGVIDKPMTEDAFKKIFESHFEKCGILLLRHGPRYPPGSRQKGRRWLEPGVRVNVLVQFR